MPLSEAAFGPIWKHAKASTLVAIALIVTLSLLQLNVYILGGYLLSAWLLSPLVTYWLVGEHSTSVSFTVMVYPKAIRIFVAYGWFVGLALLTYVWIMLFIEVVFL